MGSGNVGGLGLPSTPGSLPDLTDPTVQLARGSAITDLKTKRGLSSTLLTSGGSVNDTPTPGGVASVAGGQSRFGSAAIQAALSARKFARALPAGVQPNRSILGGAASGSGLAASTQSLSGLGASLLGGSPGSGFGRRR